MSTSDLTGAIRDAAVGGIEHAGDGTVRQSYLFGPEFPGFSGHFPGQPILPAVLQILAANQLIEAATGQRLVCSSIERAKFVNPIGPGELVEITCRRLAGAAAVWEVRIVAAAKGAASFFLTLQSPGAAA